MLLRKILPILFLFIAGCVAGQNSNSGPKALNYIVVDGDTMPVINIETVTIRHFQNKRKQIKYDKLMRNVKKAYPYAVAARDELNNMNAHLVGVTDPQQREAYIKAYEKQMFRRYEKELRALTISQGRILLKLVDREINNTAFNLIQEYRGDFSAYFWQGVARIFGDNLKRE